MTCEWTNKYFLKNTESTVLVKYCHSLITNSKCDIYNYHSLIATTQRCRRGAHNLDHAVRKEPYHLTGPLHYTEEVYLLLKMMRRGFWEHNWDMAANHMRLHCVNRSINNAYPKTSEETCLPSSANEPRLFNTAEHVLFQISHACLNANV